MLYHYVNEECLERSKLKISSRSAVTDWLDGAATCASAACLVHCLILPLVVALLPALAGTLDPGERFHRLVLLFAIPTSAFALVPAWRRTGATAPLLTGLAGLILLGAGVSLPLHAGWETALTVAGSVALAAAHVANWRARRAHC